MFVARCLTLIEQCLCGYWLALLSPPALLRQVCIVCDPKFYFPAEVSQQSGGSDTDQS